ncbi:MAG: fluoride efflux transporter CrcB, partial [Verrucomicrobiota bacterium]
MKILLPILAVGCGSALGGIARYIISTWVDAKWSHHLPLGTILVNIIGCFIIGFLAEFAAEQDHWIRDEHFRLLFLVGVLGGFTTFSSFSLQTLQLMQDGLWASAILNIFLSVLFCMISV